MNQIIGNPFSKERTSFLDVALIRDKECLQNLSKFYIFSEYVIPNT